jgi:SNF2 family DNA or RNA helicase
MKTYDEFIQSKIAAVQPHGFDPVLPLNPALFDWQKLLVTWAVRQGRAALFEDCGLGKTLQSLEWARQILTKTEQPVLILAPLGVVNQTVEEGAKFGYKVTHARQPEDLDLTGINITNYERLDLFVEVIPKLGGVVLDESSILKSFNGKTRQAAHGSIQEHALSAGLHGYAIA